MKKLTSKEIKETELNLLISFDEFCKKNNLYYTLCGGTLLGAIRHKGFIPWDDDIDVLMPRPDYDKLMNEVGLDMNHLKDYMEFKSWKKGNVTLPFMKLVDNRTSIDSQYDDMEDNKIWIDIFATDGLPEDDNKLKKLYKMPRLLRRIILVKNAKKGEGKTFIKKLLKPLLIGVLKPIDSIKLCKKIDDISKTYDFDSSDYIGGIVWGYGPQERIHKKGYMQPVPVEFEKHYFNAPSNYHEYLTGLYKDYMKLPPEDQRITHDFVAYIDYGDEN